MNKDFISVTELREYLGICTSSAYALVKDPNFYPAFKIGRRVFVRVSALEKWLDEQTMPNKKEEK